MSAEQGAGPSVLDLSFVDRVHEHVTNQQFAIVERELGKLGVFQFLQTAAPGRAPWEAFLHVTEGIEFAVATPYRHAGTVFATAAVECSDPPSCDRFYEFCDLGWSGIAGIDRPRIRPISPQTLTIESICYADMCTIGRISTILINRQYGQEMGPNARLIFSHTIGEIEDSGLWLPSTLRNRIDFFKELFGEKASDMLLSSGYFGLVGQAFRDAVEELNASEQLEQAEPEPTKNEGGRKDQKDRFPPGLESQRPRGNRPAIEKDATFYFTKIRGKKGIPVSGTTMKKALVNQAREVAEDLREPYRQRRWTKAAKDLWGIVGSLGGEEGLGLLVQALGTWIWGICAALRSQRADRRFQKRIEQLKRDT